MANVEMGKMGFVWFFGIIESLEDPLQLGRVKVRAYHFYTPNDSILPTEDLPWAHVVMPTTSASYQGKGWSPTFMRVDTTVFGFFADGGGAQMPIVLGTLPGIPQADPEFVDVENFTFDNHDVSQLARGINKLAATKESLLDDEVEPTPSFTFKAQYPYNKTFESERGHAIEMDDTPGGERIHVYHNGGSYMEMSPGMRVDKVNGTHIETASISRYIKSAGDIVMISGGKDIDGTTTIYAQGPISIISEKQISMSAPLININGQLGVSISGAAISTSATGIMSQTAGMFNLKAATASVESAGAYDVKASSVTVTASSVAITAAAAATITATGAMKLTGLAGLFLNPPAPT